MSTRKRKKGARIDRWTLIRELGSGGNADVWRAHENKCEIALKVLKKIDKNSEPYKRFRQEVQAQTALMDIPGVLPLLAHSLPKLPSYTNHAWLAMPIATPLKDSLSDAPLTEIVSAMRDISTTLVKFVEKGVFHRDIKPANLYSLNDIPTVGDFGLASIPNKEALTMPGKKLGPLFFLPDEMLNDASTAAPGPADVFMFAKTLWVFVTGAQFPPQGHIRLEYEPARVSMYWNESKAHILDGLIEKCTDVRPGARPTMAAVSEELSDWLNIGREPMVVEQNMGVIKAKLRPLISSHQLEVDQKAKTKIDCERLWNQIVPLLEPLSDQISGGTGLLSRVTKSNFINTVVRHPEQYNKASFGPSATVISQTVDDNTPYGFLASGIGLMSAPDQSMISLIAAHAIYGNKGNHNLIWHLDQEVMPNTAREDKIVRELISELHKTIAIALEAFTNHLLNPQ